MMFGAPIQLIAYFISAAVCVGNTSNQLVDVVDCNPSFHVEESVCRFMCDEPGSTVVEMIALEDKSVCRSLELVNIKTLNSFYLHSNENLESVTAPGLEYIHVFNFSSRSETSPILDFIDMSRLPQTIRIPGGSILVCMNSLVYDVEVTEYGLTVGPIPTYFEENPCSTREATESPTSAPTVSETYNSTVSHTSIPSTPTSSPSSSPTESPKSS